MQVNQFQTTVLLLPPTRRLCFCHCLSACLFVSNFAQKLPNGSAWNFQGRLTMGQWTNDYILVAIHVAVWIQELFSGFVTIGINRQQCAMLQCRACTSRYRHSNYDVITSAAHDRQQDRYHDTGKTCLSGAMHCPSASSFLFSIIFRLSFYTVVKLAIHQLSNAHQNVKAALRSKCWLRPWPCNIGLCLETKILTWASSVWPYLTSR